MESHAGKASGVTNTGTTLLLPTAGSRTNRGVTNGHEVPSVVIRDLRREGPRNRIAAMGNLRDLTGVTFGDLQVTN